MPADRGTGAGMAEMDQNAARREALRRVIERVTAWQETAPGGTIRTELDDALREANLTLTDEQRNDVVTAISEGRTVDLDRLADDVDQGGPA
ncbi:hypothetical protein [Nocardioides sambongensis]|uniref:hypothetical protein n=1 Tax=Nocardioides sambongensis TaxID=2589074 RepID=UPI0011270243|nr:hypothetical protein [Nocardioides sambongensis]